MLVHFTSELTWVLNRQNKARQSLTHLHFIKYELTDINDKTSVCKYAPNCMHVIMSIINSITSNCASFFFFTFLFVLSFTAELHSNFK